MAQIQLLGSYTVYEHGSSHGIHDFRIETRPGGGSTETITEGTNVITRVLTTGLGDNFTMNSQQAFIAFRHMQDRTKSIEEAFGADIQPRPHGVQVQGVVSFLRPKWVDCIKCKNEDAMVERMAFLLRDGYLMISTLDKNGNWHSDADDVRKAFEGVSASDIAAIICKVLATVKLSGWLWALIALCTAGSLASGGGAAILCAAGIIGLELLSITMLIAIIEEVTGRETRVANLRSAERDFGQHQFASAKKRIKSVKVEITERLSGEFPQPGLGNWLSGRLA